MYSSRNMKNLYAIAKQTIAHKKLSGMRFQATDDFAVMELKIAIKRLKIPLSIPYTIINVYKDTVIFLHSLFLFPSAVLPLQPPISPAPYPM